MYVEGILKMLGFDLEKMKVEGLQNDIFDDALDYQRGDGKSFVKFGYVNTKLVKNADLETAVFYADFSWDFVMQAMKNNKVAYTELPKFPAVRRDLALLIDDSVSFGQLKQIAFKA